MMSFALFFVFSSAIASSVTAQVSNGCIPGFRCDADNEMYHRVTCVDGMEVQTPYADALCTELVADGEVVTTTTECTVCGAYFTAITERFFNGNCSETPAERSLLAGEIGVCLDNEGDDSKVIFECTDTTVARNLYATADCSGDKLGALDASSESCTAIPVPNFTASTILFDVVCVDSTESVSPTMAPTKDEDSSGYGRLRYSLVFTGISFLVAILW